MFDGVLGRAQLGPFIKTKLVGERVNKEITNFHHLRWYTTKVVKKWQFAPEPAFSYLYWRPNLSSNHLKMIKSCSFIQSCLSILLATFNY